METSEKNTKRADKKMTNIRWNSGLYFQFGLIVSLLLTFAAMQMNVGFRSFEVADTSEKGVEEPPMIPYTLEVNTPVVVKTPEKRIEVKKPSIIKPRITDVITVVPNTSETIVETQTTTTDAPLIDTPVTPVKPDNVDDGTPKNINSVEFVPVFPGCESLANNAERKACMSTKISEFINKKFDADRVASTSDSGIQRITVQFRIDAKGNVKDVVARAKNSAMEKEAARVISQLPRMTPGRQGNTNVDVLYMVPITFNVE